MRINNLAAAPARPSSSRNQRIELRRVHSKRSQFVCNDILLLLFFIFFTFLLLFVALRLHWVFTAYLIFVLFHNYFWSGPAVRWAVKIKRIYWPFRELPLLSSDNPPKCVFVYVCLLQLGSFMLIFSFSPLLGISAREMVSKCLIDGQDLWLPRMCLFKITV